MRSFPGLHADPWLEGRWEWVRSGPLSYLGALALGPQVDPSTFRVLGINAACDDKAWRIDIGMSRGMFDASPEVLVVRSQGCITSFRTSDIALCSNLSPYVLVQVCQQLKQISPITAQISTGNTALFDKQTVVVLGSKDIVDGLVL